MSDKGRKIKTSKIKKTPNIFSVVQSHLINNGHSAQSKPLFKNHLEQFSIRDSLQLCWCSESDFTLKHTPPALHLNHLSCIIVLRRRIMIDSLKGNWYLYQSQLSPHKLKMWSNFKMLEYASFEGTKYTAFTKIYLQHDTAKRL